MTTTKKERLLSLDILRGLTIAFMILVNTPGSWSYVYAPLQHAKWHGCTPTDLVFPFFLFIVGISLAFSLKRFAYRLTKKSIQKIVYRTTLLFLIGLLLNYFPFFNKSLSHLRIMGVLQRIALSYGLAAFMISIFKRKYIPVVGLLLLFLYWIILYMGHPADPYSLEGNITTAIDRFLIGEAHMYKGFGIPFEPEGLLATMSACVSCLFGYMIGRFILDNPAPKKLMSMLALTGIGGVLIGQLWHFVFPINKPLWTGSYVLYCGGIATLVLLGLYYLLDILKWRKWSFPFQVYGSNALFSFVLSIVFVKILLLIKIDGASLYSWIFTNIFQSAFGNYLGSFLFAITFNIVIWIFAWNLYRRRIFIKL